VSRCPSAHPGSRAVGLGLGLSLLIVPLAACGPMHPGAAATVGTTRISVNQVRAQVQAQRSVAGSTLASQDLTTVNRSVLSTMIINALVIDGAQSKGISVSDADIAAVLEQNRKQNGTDANTEKVNGIPPGELHQVAHDGLLRQRLFTALYGSETDPAAQSKLVTDFMAGVVKEHPVTVNPRYGAWEPDKFDIAASNAFSSPLAPAGSAAPAPAPAPASPTS
jgi:hypothetical protein